MPLPSGYGWFSSPLVGGGCGYGTAVVVGPPGGVVGGGRCSGAVPSVMKCGNNGTGIMPNLPLPPTRL